MAMRDGNTSEFGQRDRTDAEVAALCRRMAWTSYDPEIHRFLLELAADYERESLASARTDQTSGPSTF